MEEFKPGQVISPQAASQPEPTATPTGAPVPDRQPPSEHPLPPSPTPSPEPNQPAPTTVATPIVQAAPGQPTAPAVSEAQPEPASWQFRSEQVDAAAQPGPSASRASATALASDPLTWTASEFIAHEKSAGWYGLLALAGGALSVALYFVTKDMVTTGIVAFCVIALGIFAARKPHVQTYQLNDYGLQVGGRVYAFHDYKSFAIAEEGAIASVVFMPLKRFMPALTVYLDPEMEERVVDYLATILPFEEHHHDAVDSLMKRIRF